MKIIEILFIHAILISNLLPEIRTAHSPVPNGCVASGLTNCCTLDTCVTLGGCYCDQGCYDTSDCCEDIHQICPQSERDGTSDGGSGESPTPDPHSSRPPRITMAPEDNVTVPTAHPHRLTMLVGYDKGYPLSTLVWRKDGEIITSRRNPRVSVMSNGGISIRSVKSSDRGLYTITVSNTVGSDSASFKLYTKFARLVESEYREGSFFCEAKGYPTAHFVGWTVMNGSSIIDEEWTTLHSGTSEFESTMIASLPLHAVNCSAVGGISCVFDNGNGSYQVESPMMDCPTVIDISFEESEYSINERAANNQYIALRVCLRQIDTYIIPDTDTFTVTIATQGGTAIAGSDFVAMSVNRTFSFPLQQFEVCECISIIQDDITEGDEVFYLTLTCTHPQIKTTGAVVHIVDDDAVIASLEKTEYFVSESEGCVEVCVLLVGRYQSSVTVHLCIEGINATANEDYIGHSMALPLTFQTSALVSPEMRGRACASVMLINDDIIEGNETFRVQIQPDYDDNSVKIADQSSAIVTIIDDDTVPLTATMINDTPRVEGSMVTINFQLNGGSPAQRAALRCRITGPGRTPPVVIENCNSGVVVEELTFRKQEFNFTLEDTLAGSGAEGVVLLQRDFRLDSDVCWLHLVNQGVHVNGTSATFEWRPSGPFINYKSSSFRCFKDLIRIRENCSSPYTWSDLSPGRHRLIIEPYQTPGCRRLQNRVIYFTV